jgi:hypothetical protein
MKRLTLTFLLLPNGSIGGSADAASSATAAASSCCSCFPWLLLLLLLVPLLLLLLPDEVLDPFAKVAAADRAIAASS